MNERLKKQIQFIMEMDKLKHVFRQSRLLNYERHENSAEHSWHLAVIAMILSEYAEEELDILRVLKMVLIHDIVEIDAGDTFAYDEAGYDDKEQRENQAAERIFNMLPSDQAEKMWNLWREFEEQKTPEALYAASVDRLAPFLLNYYTEGYTWRLPGVTSAKVLKRMKVMEKSVPVIWELVQEIIEDSIKNGYLAD